MPTNVHPAGKLDWVNVKVVLGATVPGKGEARYTIVVAGLRDSYHWMWEEGNYSCDCNKSLFIRRYCDPAFPDLGCGETIEVIDIEETDEPESTKLAHWGEGDPFDTSE